MFTFEWSGYPEFPTNIYLFKVNNGNMRSQQQSIFYTFFWFFYCWIWTSKCWLGYCPFYFSRPDVFLRKSVLKICTKFTGEYLCRIVISIKLQSSFFEIALGHRCSHVNLLHIFRKLFSKNTSGWLLLIQDLFNQSKFHRDSFCIAFWKPFLRERWLYESVSQIM